MRRLALALALAVLMAAGAGCDTRHGSTKPKPTPTMNADDTFKKDCIVKGGKPVIVRNNGKTTRTCLITFPG